MKQSDLEILLQEGEGTTLEFKEGLSASFAREMVALANTLGGRILLGVRDDGTVAGIRDSNDFARPHSGHRPQLRSGYSGARGAGRHRSGRYGA
jgi:predicted HTH transcriptional regulator